MRLDPDSLEVNSFDTDTANLSISTGGVGYCCTGCVSGCGINPTAGYCESQADSADVRACDGGTIMA